MHFQLIHTTDWQKCNMTPEEKLCAYYIRENEQPLHPSLLIVPSYCALLDFAATHHYLEPEALPNCTDIHAAHGTKVIVANGGTISPILQAAIPIAPLLSKRTTHAYIFDDLNTGSLIFLGQLCDDDCVAIFSRYNVSIVKTEK